MGSELWGAFLVLIGIGVALYCVALGIVAIIKAAKGTGGPSAKKLSDVESDLAELEQELLDARKRIEVLETIVTDDRHQLRKQIDELGS